MSRSMIAALMSGLVFPGAGQWFLKRRARACLFLLPTLLAVGFFIAQAASQASLLLEQIQSGQLALDPVALAAQLEPQAGAGSPWVNLAAIVMIACWALSVIDAWLLGRDVAADPQAQARP